MERSIGEAVAAGFRRGAVAREGRTGTDSREFHEFSPSSRS